MSSAFAPPRRGWPIAAWLVVAGVVAFILYRYALHPPARDRAAWLVPLRSQARSAVGMADLKFPGAADKRAWEKLDRGPFGQRLRAAIVAGELAGPDEALARLQKLRDVEPDPEVGDVVSEVELLPLPRRPYDGYHRRPGKIVPTEEAPATPP